MLSLRPRRRLLSSEHTSISRVYFNGKARSSWQHYNTELEGQVQFHGLQQLQSDCRAHPILNISAARLMFFCTLKLEVFGPEQDL